MGNKIEVANLKYYKKDFRLEASLLDGTLIGCKDNKISCIATIEEGKNRYGEISKGIIDTSGSGLWIDLDDKVGLSNWIIEATEL